MNIIKRLKRFFIPSRPTFVPPTPELAEEIREEMRSILTKAYDNKYLNRMYESVSTKFLLDESVKMYVGSVTCPKNQGVVDRLLIKAREAAKTEEEIRSVDYYTNIFKKYDAMKSNDQKGHDEAMNSLLDLANKGHAISNYMIGKEMYNAAQNLPPSQQRHDALISAASFLNKSLEKGCMESFYYLGNIFQKGEITKKNQETAFEYFVIAASYKNPFAFFELSQYYKTGKKNVAEKNPKLYALYLKKAAELGLPEAQHNLGLEYLNGGSTIKKDQVKALGWFVHAAGSGFLPAKYNAAILFLNGTECGTLKPNPTYALSTLREVQQSGMDVTELIAKLQKQLGVGQSDDM